MEIDEKSCSGLIGNSSGGNHCKHGHATTYGCYGRGRHPAPVCVREDKRFDEDAKRVTVAPWNGD